MALKPKKTRSYYFLLTGVLGLLVVASFVVYQLYSAFTTSQVTKRQQINIAPLDGVIEPAAIENLRNRIFFSQEDYSRMVLNRVTASPATASGVVLGPQ